MGLPCIPNFSSIEIQFTLFLSPKESSLFIKIFGTINIDMPFEPSGAPGILASTRWIIFSDKLCSPDPIHIFVPVSL